jgi:hypothetical protein
MLVRASAAKFIGDPCKAPGRRAARIATRTGPDAAHGLAPEPREADGGQAVPNRIGRRCRPAAAYYAAAGTTVKREASKK